MTDSNIKGIFGVADTQGEQGELCLKLRKFSRAPLSTFMVSSMTTGRILQPNKGRAALKPKPFGNKILATLSDKEP